MLSKPINLNTILSF